MGVFIKVDEAMGYRSINLGPNELAKMVQQNFISVTGKKQLKVLRKMVKSGFWRSGTASFAKTSMQSCDKRYTLMIAQAIWIHEFVLGRRIVWLKDDIDKVVYRLQKSDFRSFRNATLPTLDTEWKKAANQ